MKSNELHEIKLYEIFLCQIRLKYLVWLVFISNCVVSF